MDAFPHLVSKTLLQYNVYTQRVCMEPTQPGVFATGLLASDWEPWFVTMDKKSESWGKCLRPYFSHVGRLVWFVHIYAGYSGSIHFDYVLNLF